MPARVVYKNHEGWHTLNQNRVGGCIASTLLFRRIPWSLNSRRCPAIDILMCVSVRTRFPHIDLGGSVLEPMVHSRNIKGLLRDPVSRPKGIRPTPVGIANPARPDAKSTIFHVKHDRSRRNSLDVAHGTRDTIGAARFCSELVSE